MANQGWVVERWKLDNINSLEEVLGLLSADYTKDEGGLILHHTWLPGSQQRYSIDSYCTNNDTYKYIPVTAKVMSLVNKQFREVLPPDYAIIERNYQVIFVKHGGAIFALVNASASSFSRIRTSLMRLKRDKKNLWGNINHNISQVDNSFFYWLLDQKRKTFNFGVEKYTLVDVSGFGSSTERTAYAYRGEGSKTDKEPPVQTMVSLGTSFYELGLVFSAPTGNLFFTLRQDFQTKIDPGRSNKIKNGQTDFYSNNELVLRTYLEVIPSIIAKYNADSKWHTREPQFKREKGLEVIKEIMAGTGLKPNDIKKYS